MTDQPKATVTQADERLTDKIADHFGLSEAERPYLLDMILAHREAHAPKVAGEVGELAAYLRDWCENDPMSKPPYAKIAEAYDTIEAQAAANVALAAERDAAVAKADNAVLESQKWKGEARCHEGSLHEAYQSVSGASGEPGNWNGARPIIEQTALLSEAVALLSDIKARGLPDRYNGDAETIERVDALLARAEGEA